MRCRPCSPRRFGAVRRRLIVCGCGRGAARRSRWPEPLGLVRPARAGGWALRRGAVETRPAATGRDTARRARGTAPRRACRRTGSTPTARRPARRRVRGRRRRQRARARRPRLRSAGDRPMAAGWRDRRGARRAGRRRSAATASSASATSAAPPAAGQAASCRLRVRVAPLSRRPALVLVEDISEAERLDARPPRLRGQRQPRAEDPHRGALAAGRGGAERERRP